MRRDRVKRLVKRLVLLIAVVGLLPVVLALVVPRVLSQTPGARRATTIVQMRLLVSELEKYRIDNNGRAPSTEQGLEALVKEPTVEPRPRHWKGPYIEALPRDGWGRDYGYASLDGGKGSRVWSLGADGAQGGEGSGADIKSWERETWAEE